MNVKKKLPILRTEFLFFLGCFLFSLVVQGFTCYVPGHGPQNLYEYVGMALQGAFIAYLFLLACRLMTKLLLLLLGRFSNSNS